MILWNASLVFIIAKGNLGYYIYSVSSIWKRLVTKNRNWVLYSRNNKILTFTLIHCHLKICGMFDWKLIKLPLVPEINTLFAVAVVGVAFGQCHLVYLHICFSLEFTIIGSSSLCCGSCNYNQVTFYQWPSYPILSISSKQSNTSFLLPRIKVCSH